jgi:hypothetical protein
LTMYSGFLFPSLVSVGSNVNGRSGFPNYSEIFFF